MQRIDENTYIDDTLVTCAEYQLFIDDWHKEGKNYQPSHWTSYQFPSGQAREPILGIRFSDAEAFCRWLNVDALLEWNTWSLRDVPYYRLPSYIEASQYPLISISPNVIGYWINGSKGEPAFFWNSDQPSNARSLDFDHGLDTRIASVSKLMQHPREDIDIAIKLEAIGSLSKRKSCPLDFDEVVSLRIDLFRGAYKDQTLDQIMAQILEQVSHKSGKARENDLKVFAEIFTLQERIAGRSPAFEGIRLVKYRENPDHSPTSETE